MKSGKGPAVRLRATDLSRITQGGKTIEELTGEIYEDLFICSIQW